MTNIKMSENLLIQLSELGVQDYVFCSGSRNAPLIQLLEKSKGLNLYSFFDECSAAFFALGRVKKSNRPVAVITTSGTAVAQLLPACIEAYYTGCPLIFITADRPKSYRSTGAPQSIEQVGIFTDYVSANYDLDCSINFNIETPISPIHINICFDEPLIDQEIKILEFKPQFTKKIIV